MPFRHHRNPTDLLRELRVRLQFWLFVLLVIAGAGTIGFHLLEHCTWLEAGYKTVCVLLTLGLPTHPDNQASTAFTIVLAFAGIGSFAYAASAIARTMISDDFQRAVARRKVLRTMKNLEDHHIICGFDRISEIIAAHLHAQKLAYIIIEKDEELFNQLRESGLTGYHGDASHEETLQLAGLECSRSLIVATPSDAENLLITVTARQLSADTPIVVRCDVESNAPKFMRAGATRVITPNTSGAMQIALAATKPYVSDLIDLATGAGGQEFELRQLLVPDGSPVHGHSIKDLALGARFGVIVIGIKPRGQGLQFNPSAHATIAAGDILVTVGSEKNFRELEGFLNGRHRAQA